MEKFEIKVTDEYERLVKFFVENELEFDGDEEVDTDIVKCWKIEEGNHLVAGCVLAKRQGKFIIDGIAVDEPFRKFGLGKNLMDIAVEEIKNLGGSSLFLVARAPGFFRTLGFNQVDPSQAPIFFECAQCPQYQKTCHPEIMKLEIDNELS
jgi:N-acetylglutamate synthase-like GNAT family acetyltransferase